MAGLLNWASSVLDSADAATVFFLSLSLSLIHCISLPFACPCALYFNRLSPVLLFESPVYTQPTHPHMHSHQAALTISSTYKSHAPRPRSPPTQSPLPPSLPLSSSSSQYKYPINITYTQTNKQTKQQKQTKYKPKSAPLTSTRTEPACPVFTGAHSTGADGKSRGQSSAYGRIKG